MDDQTKQSFLFHSLGTEPYNNGTILDLTIKRKLLSFWEHEKIPAGIFIKFSLHLTHNLIMKSASALKASSHHNGFLFFQMKCGKMLMIMKKANPNQQYNYSCRHSSNYFTIS
jgi:hypothetical protein